jgi:hypothetical protein
MAELSYLWDGTVTGDATEAPYDKDEFNTYMLLSSTTDNTLNNAYVVPGYLDDLQVYSDQTGFFVSVAAGAAIMGGRYIYVNDTSVTLNIDTITSSGYFRYDYIVLRLDVVNQKIRLVVIKGTETPSALTLIPPTLTQNDFTREIPIAQIYVDDVNSSVQNNHVYDLRKFATNAATSNKYKLLNKNLVVNSEFMAFSSSDTVTPPEGWTQDNTLNSITASATTKFSVMSRGQAISIGSSGTCALQQIIQIDTSNQVFTVKGIIKNVSGASLPPTISLYSCHINGTTFGNPVSQKYDNTLPGTEIEFQFTFKFPVDTIREALLLEIKTSGGVVEVGQIIVTTGYHPGPFREINETILFRERMTNASWSDTAKSSTTNTLDLTTFGVLPRTKGVFMRTRGRDSGSAGGVAYIQLFGYAAPYNTVYGRVTLDGITNDVYRENTFFVPVDAPIYAAQDETPQLRVTVIATGASTFDATLEIVGITT